MNCRCLATPSDRDESREHQNIQMHQVLAALLPLSASRRLVESSGHWYEENLVSADGNSLWGSRGSLPTLNSKHMHPEYNFLFLERPEDGDSIAE